MNIDDITVDEERFAGRDRLDVMFELQDKLREKYGIPILDLDVPEDQSIAREMAWNTTEETAEALAVQTSPNQDRSHILDELADAVSFYLELLIICGMTSSDFEPAKDGVGDKLDRWFHIDSHKYETNLRKSHSFFVEKLALAINNLKNRKWRKTNLHTNEFTFKKDLYYTFIHFIRFCKQLDVSSDQLFNSYLKKHEVNLFRIESKY